MKKYHYKESKIFELKDIIVISNLKFIHDQMNKILPRASENLFINKTRYLYYTKRISLDVLQVKTMTYGSNSFELHTICTWNFFQNKVNIINNITQHYST